MKKIASYAFFRSDASDYESESSGAARGRFFLGFVPTLVRAHRSVFADWELRIHHDDRVREFPYFKVLEKLASNGLLTLVPCGNAEFICKAMLWRMLPIWTTDADIVICRDVDSLPTPRERKAVEDWIANWPGQAFHVIHDSPSHRSSTFLGGLCGFRAKEVQKLMPLDKWNALVGRYDLSKHGTDQHFLNSVFERYDVKIHTTDTMGPNEDPRDICDGNSRHAGGAFHAGPVKDWYDKYYPDRAILDCEASG